MNPIRAWSRFWFAPVSAAPLGAFRILFGLICLIHVACLAWEPAPWLSDAGYLRGSEARELAGWLRPSPLQWYQDPTTVNAVLAATALCAALVTAGRYTRIASVLLYLGLL